MKQLLALFFTLLFLGCQNSDERAPFVQINPVLTANTTDTIFIAREDTANGEWGSSVFLFSVDAEPGIYSDNISIDFLGTDNMPISRSLLTGTVAAYAGAKTAVTATAALHAYPTATPGTYRLRVTVQGQKAQSTLFRPVRVL